MDSLVAVLKHDRLVVDAGPVLVSDVAWWYTVDTAWQMSSPAMQMGQPDSNALSVASLRPLFITGTWSFPRRLLLGTDGVAFRSRGNESTLVAVLTILVGLEKVLPRRTYISRASGLLLGLWRFWVPFRA